MFYFKTVLILISAFHFSAQTGPDIFFHPAWDKLRQTPTDMECGENDAAEEVKTRIIDGKPAVQGEFPWIIEIYHLFSTSSETYIETVCAGALISSNFALTAAHCVKNNDIHHFSAGSNNIDGRYIRSMSLHEYVEGDRDYFPAKIVIHPEYQFNPIMYDLAVIKSKRNVAFDSNVFAICLPRRSPFETGLNFTISGWGIMIREPTAIQTDHLMKAEVKVLNSTICKYLLRQLITNMTDEIICSGNKNQAAICKGDSGSPLIKLDEFDNNNYYFLYGISSIVSDPKCLYYGLFVNVFSNLKFILDTVSRES